MTDSEWEKAKEHFDSVFQVYKELAGTPGVMVGPAIMIVFEPLARRYASGERSQELYEEMISVE